MERCIEGMGSMMGGMSPMGGGMMSLALLVVVLLLFVWVLGLAALGTLGLWGVRKLSGSKPTWPEGLFRTEDPFRPPVPPQGLAVIRFHEYDYIHTIVCV